MSESNGQSNGERNELTPKQLRFVQEYLVDLNATAAYIRAGYKDTPAARANAARLIANDNVQAAIQKLRAKVEKKTEITVARVLEGLLSQATMAVDAPSQAANRAWELIGQHLGMWPNESKLTLTMTDEQRNSRLAALLDAARTRRNGAAANGANHG